ncbi:rod shape-determining protein MreD [Barrientosiimonas marina]|uniref:Rod shape-determining protein MreD n=1 Tax=Lentibacillus kimchii TaxID=1542911 RepID=A0ABW2UZ65_9BACI
MKRLLIPFILFILLTVEGVALDILPVSLIKSDLIFVPHWDFVFIILIAIFYDREDTYFSVFYGLLFGLMTDIVYTGVLGPYMFSYALSAYMVHGLIKLLHANFVVTIILAIAGLLMADIFINVIFSVTSLADISWWDYVIKRLLPTVGANMVFLLAAYPIAVNPLTKWKKERSSGKSGF